MSRQQVFLIRADNDRECVMRLPVDRYGGITQKGMELIRRRFHDGATNTPHWMQYALNLEQFSSGRNIVEAIGDYYKNRI